MLHMIPDRRRPDETMALAEKYGASFEYNDFFFPSVLESEDQINDIIRGYRSLGRDTSKDTLHGPFLDITIHSEDPLIRAASDKRIRRSVDIAQELGVRAVIFHTNTIPNFRTEMYLKGWADRNEAYFRILLEDYPGLDIYMENMFDMVPDDLAALAERMKDQERFGVCLDYAHAAVFGTNTDAWTDALLPYTKHMHINDNDLRTDMHDAVGDGMIDWKHFSEVMKRSQKAPSVLIETASQEKFERSVLYMKKEGIFPFNEGGEMTC